MGRTNESIFVQLHIEAFRSGLVKALGPALWTTLQALATYMDQEGRCWPSQTKIAAQLDIRRETVCSHIQQLCAFPGVEKTSSALMETIASWSAKVSRRHLIGQT